MGLFDRIFGRNPKGSPSQAEFKTLTAYRPSFSSYSGNLYESELVRAAIHARATQVSKLKVEFQGHGAQNLRKRLERPNVFNTWSQFLYRMSTQLDVSNTVFIVPAFDRMGRLNELYTVVPSQCKLIGTTEEPWLAFCFGNGKIAQMPVYKIGVLTKFQYKSEFFGENNSALNSTLSLINIQEQAVEEAVKSSATYRFIAQMDNFAFADDLKKERERFNEMAFGSGSGGGLLLLPNTYKNVQQIKSTPYVADAAQLEIIRRNVKEYYQVNDDVLQGKAVGDSWSAFYETAIEPLAIQFSEVLSDMLFLNGALEGDCKVFATANRLQFMSTSEKKQFVSDMLDRGVINRDEAREVWNLPPLPNGEGEAYVIRGEYKNADEQINGGEDGAAE